jgi:hypothetical protein
MMPIRPVIVMFCALAAFDARAISAQTAGATQVASAAPATPPATAVVLVDGKPIGAAEAWGAKPAGAYDVVLPMSDGMMIASLSIGEEAGKLVGKLRPSGGDHDIVMDAVVNGTDLVLTLKREHGPITLHLQRRGDRVSGNWTVGGMDTGTLEGVARK